MTSLALYQIGDQYLIDLKKLEELDLDPATFADTLESMGGDFEIKAQNVVMFMRNRDVIIKAMKDAERAMSDRRKQAEKHLDNMAEYLKLQMERVGILKIECPEFTIAVQKNPGKVVIDDEGQVPAFFWKTPEAPPPPPAKIDLAAIKEAIQDGEEVAGAHFEKGTRLVIK